MLAGVDVDLWPVGLVVSEAMTNVVLHAYRDREPGSVRLEASVAEGLLTVVVADDGIGMSPRADSPGLGMGLVLIRRLAENVDVVSERGTRLLVRLRLTPATG
jgi:serine/threonine-protein kinase RsbW/stage II sporulation protein AB (anti-sigma F factor)